MDGWFLLSIGLSFGLSVLFMVMVTDPLKTQVTEVLNRLDMLLSALEECQLARLTRNAQGKVVGIAIDGDSARKSAGKDAGR